ncbi:GNAT family N-acetyltransferase [Aliikangiella sp. G2MR2-5]|uniref:GNAT family N-acetyltransferase n=1 Tax=Aliikangiella sp. G2MR2-5 TaxID=2788943 RepID=UPI0018AA9125|nr:GNAT family N-acetyltransferase [Aliikangiella sp. G2MR2-5]
MDRIDNLHFYEVDWSTSAHSIMAVRHKVFIIEQRFNHKMLKDRHDPYCHHILVSNQQGEAIGSGRLNQDGRIGRIAVLMNYRGLGVGTRILSELIKIAQQSHIPRLSLNAETDLSHFYDQQNFSADGPVYMKQGVPYQRMTKRLA